METSGPRPGRDAADDALLDTLLLALRLKAPAVFQAANDNFTAISAGNRERLPEAFRAEYDARQAVLAQKLAVLQRAELR